jgi:hypothetical protein
MDIVEVDEQLARRAGDLSEAHRLREYDAVHLAAAERIRDADFVLVAGSSALLEAGSAAGIAVAPSLTVTLGCKCKKDHARRGATSASCRDEGRDGNNTMPPRYHGAMAKNLTVRLPEQLAADAEALARVEGHSLNETIKQALAAAIERRRKDPKFQARLRMIIDEDRELLERLAK